MECCCANCKYLLELNPANPCKYHCKYHQEDLADNICYISCDNWKQNMYIDL